MFDFIRTHQRLMQFLLLLVIFPSFVLVGAAGFSSFTGRGAEIAKVGAVSISVDEFNRTLREQLDRAKQAYGPEFDPQLLNTPEMRKNILDQLVNRKASEQESKKAHIAITDEALSNYIYKSSGLTKADGSFDTARYESILAMRRMSKVAYEEGLREDLKADQIQRTLQSSAITAKVVAERVALISEQERDVQSIGFKAKDYLAEVKLSDEQIRAFYEKSAAQFEIPESVTAEYVVLSADALAEKITVSDAELTSFYGQNKNRYVTEETRQASHILLTLKKDASEADKKAVTAKAEALLAQLRKDPSSFAKLAKENSQDPGSAQNGGDLGYFKRDAMVKPFADAAFSLKQGELSGLVKSDYGIHIIQLTGIKPAAAKSLDEVRGELTAEIKKQKASKAFAEAAENFTNLVEQSDNLQAVAEKMNLKLEKVSNLGRQPNPALPPTVVTNNPKFLKAIFADDVISKKHNIDPTDVGANTLVSARVLEYKSKSKRPFDEVKSAIQAQLQQTEAQNLAKKAGLAKIAALKAADSSTGFSEVKVATRAKKSELDPAALDTVLKADVQKLPAYVGVEIAGGYEVYRISKVSPGTPDLARRANEGRQIEGVVGQQDVFAYLEALKQRLKVSVNQAALNTKSVADALNQ